MQVLGDEMAGKFVGSIKPSDFFQILTHVGLSLSKPGSLQLGWSWHTTTGSNLQLQLFYYPLRPGLMSGAPFAMYFIENYPYSAGHELPVRCNLGV